MLGFGRSATDNKRRGRILAEVEREQDAKGKGAHDDSNQLIGMYQRACIGAHVTEMLRPMQRFKHPNYRLKVRTVIVLCEPL